MERTEGKESQHQPNTCSLPGPVLSKRVCAGYRSIRQCMQDVTQEMSHHLLQVQTVRLRVSATAGSQTLLHDRAGDKLQVCPLKTLLSVSLPPPSPTHTPLVTHSHCLYSVNKLERCHQEWDRTEAPSEDLPCEVPSRTMFHRNQGFFNMCTVSRM